jgi:hypothetical protein
MSSPGVQTREIDRTLTISNSAANGTGFVGLFRWGPAEQIVQISTNESELVQRFGRPDNVTSIYFHSALNYLLYTNPLNVVRAVGTDAFNAVPTGETPVLVKNDLDYETNIFTGISFIGRYPGELGNSISISAANSVDYENWQYADLFDFEPASPEEFNMVVLDTSGLITGTVGGIVERYSNLTKVEGSKRPDGTDSYIKTVLENQSNFVLVGDIDAILFTESGSVGLFETELQGGVDDNDPLTVDFVTAWQTFDSDESFDIVRTFTSGSPANAVSAAIDVSVGKEDRVTFAAPPLDLIYNNLNAHTDVIEFFNVDINKNTSYAFYVDNWKLVYDKYNGKNIWIPCDSDAAALHALLFINNEPWESPAGLNRGQLRNVIKLAWASNKTKRDLLYRNNINSIIALPGEGTVLFGDKTALRRQSAFNRINVRTLFLVLKKNIARSARYQLFELNDPITRGVFRTATTQYLDQVQARRGLEDKRVVCDESNNTAQVRQNNEFVGDIYLKPTYSINNIMLNFIAVGASVSFEEVEGV